ncbi:acetyl-CoA carboxylase carboxyl transferase subunit beta [Clostridium saccharoperbutylacetonicum]|uniref:Acetyl-coenzyme A carboxylase carboxyl transferase subunit beta n=1 Tax=Clostridium saccharoperbutylacetonicum N1-4(HMT) TaxID=931276 RepID=M1MK71_9CLOT|nr:acetyl-CoA carboxylase, carboxyltransferase subunit beta [Clostridium saccharoperbutylacetonicum]AGF56693.1 acetyl-coenzyme A carboxylase carboxyl transferase subunit beta [Clostridium saccharoperbutylacetonicum N1-4(HMT)]NRT62552.1 acetyl-CoA carboxylase carboxyl transferase subunit beta [Clostridium saccharoperbutylacetonicum]NSB25900.1 acetyl-CoA carboxylase carboxyl transferase subunit beta [Clostridium saccharoperbutylacetonicum]NSB45258.1 acetyl-CoA carboxylase carboxyl transferase sub
MLKDLFKKKKYGVVKHLIVKKNHSDNKPNIPSGMWKKCDKCNSMIYIEDLEKSKYVCPNCDYHFRLNSEDRIKIFFDKHTFIELFKNLRTTNPLNFKDYEEKLKGRKTNSTEAVVTGTGKVYGIEVAGAVMDSFFMMGSMGTVVGEKITRLVEYATENKLPLIIFTTSGGARMQEGIFSLMQMAKISAAIAKHDEAGFLYITILTDPTTGGVTASFAMEGDIILSEPNALVGFAGRRVIENTIKESLPDDFQKAEFLIKKGFIDGIVPRRNMRELIHKILVLHEVRNYE